MPPVDPKNSGQARVDAIFQIAKKAQGDATKEALTEAFGAHPTEGEKENPSSDEPDPVDVASPETVVEDPSPQENDP